jgi:multidrug efflux pump
MGLPSDPLNRTPGTTGNTAMILTNYSIQFRISVFVLIVILAIAGPLVYLNMPREGAPDITIPYVFLSAPYEGVAPEEIENLISIPLEKRLKDLENIKEMRSTSAEGMSFISIEFTPAQDIDTAVQKVKDKIDLTRPDLPADLDEPTVQGLNFSTDIPVLNFAISGDNDLERLKHIAEDLQDTIETIPGVLQARLYGARTREIRIAVDLERLLAHSLTLGDIMTAIRRENATLSAGNLEMQGNKFQVRIPGEFQTVEEFRSIIVKTPGGAPIRLSDVAEILDTYKDLDSVSRINGTPCISIAVHKRAGENADRLIRQIKKTLSQTPLPPGIHLTIVNDESEIIRMMTEDLENNIASGFILVVVILLLFLGLRNSILVGLAIPFSLLLGFVVLALLGLTLNMIVLFSLVLVVGMLVDNAIVIVENIYRRHCNGESRLEAARHGASEVAWPVITSTLTTVAAFAPMIYWPGIMGQFMSILPETVIIILMASLFVALVINPALCSVWIKQGRMSDPEQPGRWNAFCAAYQKLLRGALAHRGKVVLIGLGILLASIGLFHRYGLGVELFPETEPRRATIEVRYPEGTDIHTTDEALKRIEQGLATLPGIKFFLARAGSGGDNALSAGSGGTHLGSIQVEFPPFAERTTNTLDLVQTIRAGLPVLPGTEVKVDREKEGPPSEAPISIEVAGEDFAMLGELADTLIREIRTVPGLVDLQKDLEEARPELQFHVDRDRAALFKLNTAAIGNALRTAVNGTESGKFRAGEDEYDITVRLREDQRQSVDLLKRMALTTEDGVVVPLASLGSFSYAGGRGQIQRKDQKRVVTITGFNAGRGTDKILADVKARISAVTLPKNYSVTYAGENKDMAEAMSFLGKAFAVALALIALILVMEFNSILLPFIIMVSVLLSMIGVLWSLLACDMRFGVIMTGIGVISLAGVVVNNGIVLIDCINQYKLNGLNSADAIIKACTQRLRPVLLTAITTLVGLFPMAIGWSLEMHRWPPRIIQSTETSAWWAPMAVAVMFGLGVATLLTLIQVPVMVSLADSLAAASRRAWQRIFK